MSGYAFFWGCTIPARYPFMEKSLRMVMDILGIDYQDLDGFTCCPEKTLVKNHDEFVWTVTAARNVAVAERQGLNLLSACTGCYSTLRSVSSRLHAYPAEAAKVNEKLSQVDVAFQGKAKIKHIVEVFHDEVGLARLREHVVAPLSGMRIAVHGGCHLVRPSKAIHFDDPFKPTKYDRIIEALGALSIDTATKMLCCGGYLARTAQQDLSLEMAKRKLRDLAENGVDAMTTTCPECFKVYDNFQFMLQRKGETFHVPVLVVSELLGLAFGLPPEELGLQEHKIDCAPFLSRWEAIRAGEMTWA